MFIKMLNASKMLSLVIKVNTQKEWSPKWQLSNWLIIHYLLHIWIQAKPQVCFIYVVGILEEIRHYNADVVSLQEVETEQFYQFFAPEFEKDGYQGIFAPKSRAKTMQECDAKHVDGCAIFWKTSK